MAAVQQTPSHENFASQVNRPDMPHRSSSTQNVPSKEEEGDGTPLRRVTSNTVPRVAHRGTAHAESKPYKHDPNAEQVGHDGSVPQKIDVEGPPQPDWDRAERERQERREQQKKAEEGGSGNKDYPEQIHAGKIGVGPSIADRNRATFSEKVAGLKETVIGKLKRDPETTQHGRDQFTGELKRREREEQDGKMAEKFDKPEEKSQEKSEDKPQEQSHDKPEQHDKSERESRDKPTEKLDGKLQVTSHDEPHDRSYDKPQEKPQEGPTVPQDKFPEGHKESPQETQKSQPASTVGPNEQ